MKNKRHISQQDIARRLGVAVSTVSRALRGLPGVSDDLREKVHQIASENNYRPNPFALSLRFDAPHIIGVIVPDIATYFFSSILKSIEECAQSHGYFSIIMTSNERYEEEVRAVQNLVNMHVDGIIACLSQETTDYSHFLDLKDISMPIVLYDRICKKELFSTVTADDSRSAKMATHYLQKHGSKRIAFLGGPNRLNIVTDRKHGYIEALHEKKITIDPSLVICHAMEYNTGLIDTLALLDLPEPPDSILAMNDTLAFAAMEAIKSRNLSIPSDIALIGYTDEAHAKYVEPKLTAVRHDTKSMGRKACELLLDQINGNTEPQHAVVSTRLEVRESTRS
ncbi:MAG: LacI family transcriptional regulator [Bacteroidota bacterium]|nr:LacI family transcriptional regulator [Bacteroidota bacterium]